jgi:hypothetical protein
VLRPLGHQLFDLTLVPGKVQLLEMRHLLVLRKKKQGSGGTKIYIKISAPKQTSSSIRRSSAFVRSFANCCSCSCSDNCSKVISMSCFPDWCGVGHKYERKI